MAQFQSWAGVDAILEVDIDAVIENYQSLRLAAHSARPAAAVKADCYGLGMSEIATALSRAGCRDFFVATLAEGKTLRRLLGADPAIYILNGFHEPAAREVVEFSLTPVLNNLAQCRQWAAKGRHPAALQVDTGMSRLGLGPSDLDELVGDTELRSRLNLVLLMSHLADADAVSSRAEMQLSIFQRARSLFPGTPASLSNSAGIFLSPAFHFDLTRPGAALYGIETGPRSLGIRPVVGLHARVIQTRCIDAGTSVGYGFSFTAPKPMRLATIGVGYADGWRRDLEGRGAAWFGSHRLPMVGRVSMDSFVVDLSALDPNAIRVGDLVELIGPNQSVDDVARIAGTIGYEILTGLGSRWHRVYLSGTEDSA